MIGKNFGFPKLTYNGEVKKNQPDLMSLIGKTRDLQIVGTHGVITSHTSFKSSAINYGFGTTKIPKSDLTSNHSKLDLMIWP